MRKVTEPPTPVNPLPAYVRKCFCADPKARKTPIGEWTRIDGMDRKCYASLMNGMQLLATFGQQ